jgi:hypothetical protein
VRRQGLVVFFPSFGYAEEAMSHWQRSGALAAFGKHKQLFRWLLYRLARAHGCSFALAANPRLPAMQLLDASVRDFRDEQQIAQLKA